MTKQREVLIRKRLKNILNAYINYQAVELPSVFNNLVKDLFNLYSSQIDKSVNEALLEERHNEKTD